ITIGGLFVAVTDTGRYADAIELARITQRDFPVIRRVGYEVLGRIMRNRTFVIFARLMAVASTQDKASNRRRAVVDALTTRTVVHVTEGVLVSLAQVSILVGTELREYGISEVDAEQAVRHLRRLTDRHAAEAGIIEVEE